MMSFPNEVSMVMMTPEDGVVMFNLPGEETQQL